MINANIDIVESCRNGGSADIQTLRVNATSLDLDKSPVQCFGNPKTSDYEKIYTEYSVLRVTGECLINCICLVLDLVVYIIQ